MEAEEAGEEAEEAGEEVACAASDFAARSSASGDLVRRRGSRTCAVDGDPARLRSGGRAEAEEAEAEDEEGGAVSMGVDWAKKAGEPVSVACRAGSPAPVSGDGKGGASAEKELPTGVGEGGGDRGRSAGQVLVGY